MEKPESIQDLALRVMIAAVHQAQMRGAFSLEESASLTRAIGVFAKGAPTNSVIVQLGTQLGQLMDSAAGASSSSGVGAASNGAGGS